MARIGIIGSGPGGLASALLLRNKGQDVTIIEKDSQVGGRTKTFKQDGFTFDLGPTFLHYIHPLQEIYKTLGLDVIKELNLLKIDPNYHLHIEGKKPLICSSDLSFMEQQIAETINREEAKGFAEFIKTNRKKLSHLKEALEKPWLSPLDFFTPKALKALKVLKPFTTVWSDLNKYVKDKRLLHALGFQTKYLGMAPQNCPSLFTILSFLEYEYGVYHAMGGVGSITHKMAQLASKIGVNIILNEKCEEIIFNNNKACAVRTKKCHYNFDKIIINADFAHAMTNLIPDHKRTKWTNKTIQNKKFSCSTFMLYLGINKLYDLPHHQIYIGDNYKDHMEDITEHHKVNWSNCPFYVQNSCITDKSLAPKGKSTLYVLVATSHKHPNIEWNRIKEKFSQKIIQNLSKVGLHDIENHIISKSIITAEDWSQDIYKGAVFNLNHSLDQLLYFRPHNKFEDFENIYLVGGGTHPGSGLPTIFESARISSKLILDNL